MSLTPTLLQQYDRAAPKREDTETATVALGCFWGPNAKFGAMDGAVRTRVSYAGGGDHCILEAGSPRGGRERVDIRGAQSAERRRERRPARWY